MSFDLLQPVSGRVTQRSEVDTVLGALPTRRLQQVTQHTACMLILTGTLG